jgi:hypothetical protein
MLVSTTVITARRPASGASKSESWAGSANTAAKSSGVSPRASRAA